MIDWEKLQPFDTVEQLLATLKRLPQYTAFALWLQIGQLLFGIPATEWIEAQNIMLTASKRQLAGKRLNLTTNERLRLGHLMKRINGPLREITKWLVSPQALIRWLKRYQERKANSAEEPAEPKKPGPKLHHEAESAILLIYRAGLTGLKRIRGELAKLGITPAKSTVRKILDKHGLPPGPDNRTPGSTWSTFWRNHAPNMVGIDFIQIPVGLFGKVVNHFVLFGIEHDTRRVHLLGITPNPNHQWVRNVIAGCTGFDDPLVKRKYWIHDRDTKLMPVMRNVLEPIGLKSVPISVKAPDMNAFAERWVRSIREECLDHIVFLSETHLRKAVTEYIEHYNTERPHQGLGNRPVGEWTPQTEGEIVCDERLGGLLKSFRRAA